MPKQLKPKPRPVGRPKMAHGEAKGKIVALRFSPEDHAKVSTAAKVSGLSLSEWIRSVLNAAV